MKYVEDFPEASAALQKDQLLTEYGSGLTPDMIGTMPNRDVQLLRLVINAKARKTKKQQRRDAFYAKAGIKPVV